MLTAASNLHHARLLCIFAIFAAVLAVFLAWTITWGVGAFFLLLILCHLDTPCSEINVRMRDLRTIDTDCQAASIGHLRTLKNSGRLAYDHGSLPFAKTKHQRPVQLNGMLFPVNIDNQVCWPSRF